MKMFHFVDMEGGLFFRAAATVAVDFAVFLFLDPLAGFSLADFFSCIVDVVLCPSGCLSALAVDAFAAGASA